MSKIQIIRQKILDKEYYISSHAEDEILDDELTRADIENAVLKGRIGKMLTHDVRGIRYRIEGPALDGQLMHVLCRFKEVGNIVIITVYSL